MHNNYSKFVLHCNDFIVVYFQALSILSGHMTSSGDVLLAHSLYIRPVFETIVSIMFFE